MSKFSYEAKVQVVQLVEVGEAIGSISRRTCISLEVIQNALAQCLRFGPESLANTEMSIELGIKGSSTDGVGYKINRGMVFPRYYGQSVKGNEFLLKLSRRTIAQG